LFIVLKISYHFDGVSCTIYRILLSIVRTFCIENDAEILYPVNYTWTNKGFKMAFMMNKLAMINSCEIILEKKFAKNHCEITLL
jgi:hypothetical protein